MEPSTASPTPQPQQQCDNNNKPRDGPATTFEADPKVNDIFLCKDGDYYGLVLVAGWPPDESGGFIMDNPYSKFLQQVRKCFDPEDLQPTNNENNNNIPAVYLYPSRCIHVTIATFARPEKKMDSTNNMTDYTEFERVHQSIVEEASKLPNWPTTKPIELVIKSTQLGSQAGILLWDDLSGGIDKIRQCLQQVVAKQRKNIKIHAIPNIIHSTFLRFTQNIPQSKGQHIQQKYQQNVLKNIKTIFTKSILAKTVKLVRESTPYMHIPDDKHHVLLSLSLT